MSLTVLTPSSGGLFGPGFTVTVETDLIGPLEPGSFWTLELSAPAGEEVMTRKFLGFVTNSLSTLMVSGDDTHAFLTEARPEWTTGASGRLRITLDQPSFGLADSINVPIELDRQAGQNYEMSEWLRSNPTTSGAGLTPEEHEAVLQTNVGVIAMAGFPAADLVGAVGDAIRASPPFGWGSLSGPYTITGDGELPDLDALQDRYGVYWLATEIPPGLGHVHGNTEEYLLRLVQWRLVHIVGGSEMVTELADFNWHGGLWRFSGTRPHRVEYSILPGVTIQARWWQFP